jgi:C-terminal processing protease CtpA/Prc
MNDGLWKKIVGAVVAVCFAVMAWTGSPAQEPKAATEPFTDWQKLVKLLKEHYADKSAVTDARLNEAMVKGILNVFGDRARLVENSAEAAKPTQSIARAEAIGGTIGYVRFATIDETSASALDKELEKMGVATLRGLALDLRFADGSDFAHAAAVASRFTAKGTKLFRVRDAAANQTQEFINADIEGATMPIAVLVNGQTRGAAEAIAGALRAHDRCIVIGNPTAGLAAVFSDFPLDATRTLRLATGRVEFSAEVTAFPRGLTPDVKVDLSEAVERDVLLVNPPKKSFTEMFAPRAVTGRLTEAELVKQHRGEATTLLQTSGAQREKPEEIKDTVLQRAVDLLRGVAALRGN